MLKGHSSSTGAALARAGNLFLLTWLLVPGNAQADRPMDPGPDGKPDTVFQSVKSMKLKVSANGRYFIDQDDKPFFCLASVGTGLFSGSG